jgi:hypothetical protein
VAPGACVRCTRASGANSLRLSSRTCLRSACQRTRYVSAWGTGSPTHPSCRRAAGLLDLLAGLGAGKTSGMPHRLGREEVVTIQVLSEKRVPARAIARQLGGRAARCQSTPRAVSSAMSPL